MKNRRNYYRILHVGADAPRAVIQASYRTLMHRLKMHPDLGGDHAQAALINEAYATLSDPDRRAAYDRTLARASEQRRVTRLAAPTADIVPRPATRTPQSPATCSLCGAPFGPIDAEYADRACATCGSALSPAPRHRVSEVSRRAIERLPRHMSVTFRLSASRHVEWSGATEDVSLNGMRLLADVRIPIGERLQIECTFCSAVAIVRSTRRDDGRGRSGWQYGVEFLTLRIKHERGGLISTVA
jgi:hypothetical protein